MTDNYQDLTIAVGESGISWRPKYAASLVDSTDLDEGDENALTSLSGYGDTPLEAAANLLALMQRRRNDDR